MPYTYVMPEDWPAIGGHPLGGWVADQRRHYAAGTLEASRVAELEALGMVCGRGRRPRGRLSSPSRGRTPWCTGTCSRRPQRCGAATTSPSGPGLRAPVPRPAWRPRMPNDGRPGKPSPTPGSCHRPVWRL
ncbi:helicase associated domain-containing protein [Streptomyces sp. NPDC007851]|uniref:helicase associated domain-containing protein n=1 Tax=Streptomyces sp. NPDC007851 TaxID=3155008 RepID=UPI0033F871F3